MSDIYRALGDSTRRRIVSMLKQGDKTQKEIVEAFDISQPAIKKHLNILLEERIILETERKVSNLLIKSNFPSNCLPRNASIHRRTT